MSGVQVVLLRCFGFVDLLNFFLAGGGDFVTVNVLAFFVVDADLNELQCEERRTDEVILGSDFILERADVLGAEGVINRSLLRYFGTGQHTTFEEQVEDTLLRSGHALLL